MPKSRHHPLQMPKYPQLCCGKRRKEGWICNNTTAPMNVWVSTLRRLDRRAYPCLRPLRECLVSPLGSAAPSVVVSSRTPDFGLVTYGSVGTSKGRKNQTSALQLSASMLSGPQTGFNERSAPTMTPRGCERRQREVSCLGQCCSWPVAERENGSSRR